MIVIVGAGLAGLVCANVLARHGHTDFVLLESEPAPGGRVRSQRTADGFTLDCGFQVLLDSYPAARRHLDIPALAPRYFDSGAIMFDGAESWTVAHPLRHPAALAADTRGTMFPASDKARLLALVFEVTATADQYLLAGARSSHDISTAQFLWNRGFTPATIERFFRPFFGGVFLDEKLGTSAALFRYYLKKFAHGRALLPAGGMGEIPRQLAGTLPAGTLHLGCAVTGIEREGNRAVAVHAANGKRFRCARLILATNTASTARLLEQSRPAGPPPHGATVVYYSSACSLYRRPMLVLPAGRGRLVRHFVQLTNIAPEYAPAGRHLIAATILDGHDAPDDALQAGAAGEITALYPAASGALEPLAVVRVPYALRQQPPGFMRDNPPGPAKTSLENVWLTGDQTTACSIQSAMASGESAATFLARAAVA